MYILSREYTRFSSMLGREDTEFAVVGGEVHTADTLVTSGDQGNIVHQARRFCAWSSEPFVVVATYRHNDDEPVRTAWAALAWNGGEPVPVPPGLPEVEEPCEAAIR
jgi:hypothetical protein